MRHCSLDSVHEVSGFVILFFIYIDLPPDLPWNTVLMAGL